MYLHVHSWHHPFSFFLWLGYFNSTLNPIIYTVFSPEFRWRKKQTNNNDAGLGSQSNVSGKHLRSCYVDGGTTTTDRDTCNKRKLSKINSSQNCDKIENRIHHNRSTEQVIEKEALSKQEYFEPQKDELGLEERSRRMLNNSCPRKSGSEFKIWDGI